MAANGIGFYIFFIASSTNIIGKVSWENFYFGDFQF
jgi:hypothetical protein